LIKYKKMKLNHNEIESTVEDILDYIADEFQTHFSKESEIEYAIEFLINKLEKLDIEDI